MGGLSLASDSFKMYPIIRLSVLVPLDIMQMYKFISQPKWANIESVGIRIFHAYDEPRIGSVWFGDVGF